MSEIANSEGASESEKPVHNDVTFPPFPEPTDQDFDEDISEEERIYYKTKFKDLNDIKNFRLHCSACDRHMGCVARNERMRAHPMLRTLVCHSCHTFYNSGEFEKGDDGSELYCRWCGQGGQVYCCSDCPHVFCAKCIKRNLGAPKIKEIESAEDWKCFKCAPECLKDLRSICWAVLRYCDLKNKITHQTQDLELKAAYQKECALDLSECCRHKTSKRNQRISDTINKKKEIQKEVKKESDAKVAAVISKMPSTIQVKKFASISPEETPKPDKKAQKRSASPKQKSILVKNPITIVPCTKLINPTCVPPLAKKIRFSNSSINTPIRYPNASQERKAMNTYARIRPKLSLPMAIANNSNLFNGFPSNVYPCVNPVNDNINLSLESLTQGLDMAAVAALSNNTQNNNNNDDDVVCTPDFPLEPLCEVTEDVDDDVECITPGPVAVPKLSNPPPLVPRSATAPLISNVADVTPENIIQMTDNDVTVNEATGGLKFRVDPQTLSSNKMYRLPDGRIFAINANANMPGGYSATIVAVTEANKSVPKGATFAAKLSSVSTSTPTNKSSRSQVYKGFINSKRNTPKITKTTKTSETSTRECDLNVPVEWYRYNLIDAVDALEYSLLRLNKLKKEATSVFLRTRTVNEMRSLHRSLERLLNTSSSRFNEIRENLNKGLQQYIAKKACDNTSDEDDDVEILPDADDDPIFIDENSLESNPNGSENQEVDLTGPGSSEYNDSGENRIDNFSKSQDSLLISQNDNANGDSDEIIKTLHCISNNDSSTESVPENKDVEIKVNGLERNTQKDDETKILCNDDLKCDESMTEINGLIESSLNNKEDDQSKNNDADEIYDTDLKNKADSKICDAKLMASDEKILDTIDILEEKKVNVDKAVVLDKKIDSPADKTENSENKSHDADDEMQDLDDKTQDREDKLQDTEMSEELIETLLNDDNSRDDTANSEVSEALQVT